MGRKQSVSFPAEQEEALTELIEDGEADSFSGAVRLAVDRGLTEMGYVNGEKVDTALRYTVQRFRDALGLLSLILIGATFFLPLGFRLFVVPTLAMALSMDLLDRFLVRREPAISNSILTAFGGGNR